MIDTCTAELVDEYGEFSSIPSPVSTVPSCISEAERLQLHFLNVIIARILDAILALKTKFYLWFGKVEVKQGLCVCCVCWWGRLWRGLIFLQWLLIMTLATWFRSSSFPTQSVASRLSEEAVAPLVAWLCTTALSHSWTFNLESCFSPPNKSLDHFIPYNKSLCT